MNQVGVSGTDSCGQSDTVETGERRSTPQSCWKKKKAGDGGGEERGKDVPWFPPLASFYSGLKLQWVM